MDNFWQKHGLEVVGLFFLESIKPLRNTIYILSDALGKDIHSKFEIFSSEEKYEQYLKILEKKPNTNQTKCTKIEE